MKHIFSLVSVFLFFGLSQANPAFCDHPPSVPASPGDRELTEASITRTASSSLSLSVNLSKNVYRYVEREEVYVEDVPYYVEVPYTDFVTDYRREERCGHVSVPYRDCHMERRCRTIPPVQRCEQVKECTGEGRARVCRVKPVCRPSGPPTQECHNENICHTHYRNEYRCEWVSVPYQRPVTRTRTETRYRKEQRRRTVTDKLFDHSWGAEVVVLMPEESRLQGGEQETLLVRLAGSEDAPDAEVMVDSPIFNYKVADKQRSQGRITVAMRLVPKFQPEELSEQTILSLSLVRPANDSSAVTFTDKGNLSRVATEYQIEIQDKDTGKWVFVNTVQASFGPQQVSIPVDVSINHSHDHLLRLVVSRTGIVLAAPVRFQKDVHQVGQLNPTAYIDPNGVREFAIEGAKRDATLTFLDITANDGKVEVQYEIALKRRSGWSLWLWKTTISRATFSRTDLTHDASGRIGIPVGKFPGVGSSELDELFEPGDKVYVETKVTRVSPRLRGNSPVVFEKEAKIRVR